MTEALIFDAIRTPRGTGKAKGSLYEVVPVNLLGGLLRDMQQRHDFDTSQVDDIVMGVVSPVGEQGSCVPKIAALAAGWHWNASGVQLNRFCASGLEAVNLAAQKTLWWRAALNPCHACRWVLPVGPGLTIRNSIWSSIMCRKASALICKRRLTG